MHTPRLNCASGVIHDKLYMIGGDDGNQALASAEAFDADTCSWEVLPPMGQERFFTASAFLDDQLYVIGGDDGDESLRNVEVLDTVAYTWETRVPMLIARLGLRAV